MLELSDKDFKPAMIKIFQQAITHKLETNEKTENLRKEIEEIKKTQMEILEQKNSITEISQWIGSTAEWK